MIWPEIEDVPHPWIPMPFALMEEVYGTPAKWAEAWAPVLQEVSEAARWAETTVESLTEVLLAYYEWYAQQDAPGEEVYLWCPLGHHPEAVVELT
ncbi:hypothetical protein [Streptomyces sp. NBC_01304]|uniref:hypothetical protein n=1 Tax=Streptomyces sp. NBC_01304 TaxID=2903818 RepID=UPI002E0D4D27|nr:hypothetical protein OG430_33535 [Streptomyces sp. NBC_01304]